MKRRWALVVNEVIANVVEQDGRPQIEGDWQEITGTVGPGDVAVNGRMFRAGSPELAAYLEQKGNA